MLLGESSVDSLLLYRKIKSWSGEPRSHSKGQHVPKRVDEFAAKYLKQRVINLSDQNNSLQ